MKSQNVKLVIFDMDGLMFDSEVISQKSWEEAFKEYGYELTKEVFVKTLGGNKDSNKELFKKVYDSNFPFDEVFELRNRISRRIVSETGVPIKYGLRELLEFLYLKKVKMAVATSASKKRAMEFLSKAGVINYFDCIVCGDEVEVSKPDPEIFLKVNERLNVEVENTIVLEDSEAGIEAAYNAGMSPIMIPDVIQPSKEIEKMYYCKFEDLTGVIDLFEEE